MESVVVSEPTASPYAKPSCYKRSGRRGLSRTYHTTGFTRDEITDLAAIINCGDNESGAGRSRSPSLGLYRCVCVTLIYLRRDRIQGWPPPGCSTGSIRQICWRTGDIRVPE